MSKKSKADSWSPFSCQSLLGYAAEFHKRSGGICAYCDYGKGSVDFNMWRQLSLEHVIPRSIIYSDKAKDGLRSLLSLTDQDWSTRKYQRTAGLKGVEFQRKIEAACCVTACHFCNSMTSRFPDTKGHYHKFLNAFTDPEVHGQADNEAREAALLQEIERIVRELLPEKRAYVSDRISKLRAEFEGVATVLKGTRNQRR